MTRRLPVAAFVALAIATVAAFFITQHLKVTTPLIAGYPAPHPAAINPVSGGTCTLHNGLGEAVPTDFRHMEISFYLLKRADDVDVTVVTADGRTVATLATNRHMARNVRTEFSWDGRRSDGQLATGRFYVQVSLVHQGRTIRIANQNTGDLEPVRVQDGAAPIKVTSIRARSAGAAPAVIPQASGRSAVVHFTPSSRTPPIVQVYRTDLPGRPRLVNEFHARTFRNAFWDGTLRSGRPAPQGTYLIGLRSLDRTCSRQRFPARIPPTPGSTAGAGVTVRYLAAQPPMTAVAPGATATVGVDARRHRYAWALRAAGARAVLSSGHSTATSLAVNVPGGADGLYELAVRYGPHRTVVPIVAGSPDPSRGARRGPLVVLPALTWQGRNPVDDSGDGLPNTLASGQPIRLDRPLVDGLPAGLGDEAGLLRWLRTDDLPFTLTTDVSLLRAGDGALRRWPGIALAGSERWLPASLGNALQTYVTGGGHVMSLGIDALRRSVTVSGQAATDPGAPQPVDFLQARPGPVRRTRGSIILVDADRLHIFSGTSQALRGFASYQTFGPVQAPASIVSSAGVSPESPAIVGYRLGRGAVVDIGLPGFGSALRSNVDAQQIVARVWRLLRS